MNNCMFSSCLLYDGMIFFQNEIENWPGKFGVSDYQIRYAPKLDICNGKVLFFEKYVVVGRDIYAITVSGKQIIHLDKNNDEKEIIEFDTRCEDDCDVFACIACIGDYIYLFMRRTKLMIKFNMKTKEVIYVDLTIDPWLGCVKDEKVILLDNSLSKLWNYDVTTDCYEEYVINEHFDNLRYIERINVEIYAMDVSGKICVLSFDQGKWGVSAKYGNDLSSDMMEFCVSGDKIVELPCLGKDLFIISKKDGSIEKYTDYPSDFTYTHPGWSSFAGFVNVENYRIYAMRSANYILKIDRQNYGIEFVKLQLPKESESISFFCRRDGYVSEKDVSLKAMVMYIADDKRT